MSKKNEKRYYMGKENHMTNVSFNQKNYILRKSFNQKIFFFFRLFPNKEKVENDENITITPPNKNGLVLFFSLSGNRILERDKKGKRN